MKNKAAIIALLVSLGTAGFVALSQTGFISKDKDYGTSDPKDIPRKFMDATTKPPAFRASTAYLSKNREEILSTLEVVDASVSEDFGIVFFRYSVGTQIVREAYWIGKVDKKWYLTHLSRYSGPKPKDLAWFEEMTSKKDTWEEASAVLKFQ